MGQRNVILSVEDNFIVLSTGLGKNVHMLKYSLCKLNNVIECIKENEIKIEGMKKK